MLYLHSRYYNPADGRFQSRDTWGGDANRPMSMNRWTYVEANPVNYADPTGKYRDCPIGYVDTDSGCVLKVSIVSDDEPCVYVDEPNWPDNPPWDVFPAPITWQKEIDILFNPWGGYSYRVAFTDPDRYHASTAEWRRLSKVAYDSAELNLRQIVNNASNNPLTEVQAIDMVPGLLIRSKWTPYSAFLKEFGLMTGPQYVTNYEPRFLEGLMVAYPTVLRSAQTKWLLEEAQDPTLADIRQMLRTRGGLGPQMN